VTRRIGLLGGECTGKSTLARALAPGWSAEVVPEALRAFVAERRRPPTAQEQGGLLAAQQAAEDAAAARSSVLIADPAALMTAIYSIAYFDDSSLIERGCSLAAGYELVVWCGTDLPWEPDGLQRDGPQARAQVDALIREVVETRLMPRGVRVLHVDGPTPDRVAAVERAWQRSASEEPT
jgi:nicotinamide riboside kinase